MTRDNSLAAISSEEADTLNPPAVEDGSECEEGTKFNIPLIVAALLLLLLYTALIILTDNEKAQARAPFPPPPLSCLRSLNDVAFLSLSFNPACRSVADTWSVTRLVQAEADALHLRALFCGGAPPERGPPPLHVSPLSSPLLLPLDARLSALAQRRLSCVMLAVL
eukprot:1430709-Rhodomonas_salina.1